MMKLAKIKFPLVLITIGLVMASCTNLTGMGVDQTLIQYVRKNGVYEDVVHPILGVKAKHGLDGLILDQKIFIELLNFNPPNGNVIWKRDFYTAENEAAIQCCAAVKGMQKDKLSYTLGQPKHIASHENFSQLPINEEIWMYEFGGNKIPLELRLKKDICTSARIFDWTVNVKQNHIPLAFWDSPVQYHPILKVRPNQDIADQNISPSVFRKLKNSSYVGSSCNWERDYRKVEKQVAKRFCERVVGLSEDEIIELVGQPRFKATTIPDWKCSKSGEAIWLYLFGGTNVKVRLFINNKKCRMAELYGFADEIIYIAWRQKEIRDFAIGKTMEQIIEKEGLPFVFESDGADPQETVSTSNSEEKNPMVYFVSPSLETSLYFKNGYCERSSDGAIAH